jgi:MerR family transcriptional regulator, light-induced transcriptional regulator
MMTVCKANFGKLTGRNTITSKTKRIFLKPFPLQRETPLGLPIAAVERETGLGKDTLRVWEKRYGFPQPFRDDSGDRLYPAEQIEKLKLIMRLIDVGQRPGKVVCLEKNELHALLNQTEPRTSASTDIYQAQQHSAQAETIESLLGLIQQHDLPALRHALAHAQLRLGLSVFITELVAPLTTAVGQAWAQGRFEIFEEHLYTEAICTTLRLAISSLPAHSPQQGPKVLLTTLPQEQHSLGLLMAEALLSLEACHCISLGTQTPLTDIVNAVRAHQVDVVALSFSSVQNNQLVMASLKELRTLLPPQTAVWAGGACKALHQKPLDGISSIAQLSKLAALVQDWRETQATQQAFHHGS